MYDTLYDTEEQSSNKKENEATPSKVQHLENERGLRRTRDASSRDELRVERKVLHSSLTNMPSAEDRVADTPNPPVAHYKGKGGTRQLSLEVTVHDPGSLTTFDTNALLDSGATASYVDQQLVRQYHIETEPVPYPIIVYNADGTENTSGRITHSCLLRLRIGNHEELRQLFVTELDGHGIFLGHDWLVVHNPTINWKTKDIQFNHCPDTCDYIPEDGDRLFALNTITYLRSLRHSARAKTSVAMELAIAENAKKEKKSTEELVPKQYHEYLDVFKEDSFSILPEHRPWDHVIELLDPNSKPYAGKVYPMTLEEQGALDAFLAENLETGRIQPSQSPWAASFFFVKKKDGKLRPVQDYRQLNAMTKKNKYPLPVIQSLLDRLKRAKYFTKMDVRWGYNNVRLATKEDQERAAFITNRGLFEPLVMFFGLTNSPATFQHMMNDILKPLLDGGKVVVYLDDILIFTEDLEEHRKLVRQVLQILRTHRLTCKPEKCDFEMLEIEYLGHIVSQGRVRMDPTKVEGVTTWPTPNNKKELQSFLGFANFYRRFIKDFAKIAHPLHHLTGNNPWAWGPDQQTAFDRIKQTITSAPVLAIPNDDDPFKVECDASDFAIGAVLSQKQDDLWKPIAFLSKSLSPAERNYEIWDREMLSVLTSLKEWRHFLLGARNVFEIHNDHRNLEYFRQPQNLNPRQARWYLKLRDFDFLLIHKPGSTMAKADALSRRVDHMPEGHNPENTQVTMLKPEWFRVLLTAEDIKTRIQQLYDKHHTFVMQRLHAKDPRFETEDSLVYRGGKIVIPNDTALIGDIIESQHDNPSAGHPGRAKTLEKLSRTYWWKTMKRDVFRYVQGCEVCQKAKPDQQPRAAPLNPNPIASHNYQYVSIDMILEMPEVSGKNAIFVVVDMKSKDFIAVPCSNHLNSEGVARIFRDHVMVQHGLPLRVTSDRGSNFVSNFIKELYKLLGIKGNPSTAYHPQTDGQTERMNHLIEIYLRMYCNYRQSDWPDLLPMACFAHRNTVSSSTGYTPFFMLYGRHPFTGVETHVDSPNESATLFAERMKLIQEEASATLARAQEIMKERYDLHKRPSRTYQIGDWVYVSSKDIDSIRPQKKLDDKRYGPFRILDKIGVSAYKLKLPPSMSRIHPVFNEVLLIPAKPPEFPNQRNPILIPEPSTIQNTPLWEPESIYNARWNKGTLEYLVRWKGLPSYEATWNKRPYMIEQGWKTFLDGFHRDNPDAPKPLKVTISKKARAVEAIPDYEHDWERWAKVYGRWQKRRRQQGLDPLPDPITPPLLIFAQYST